MKNRILLLLIIIPLVLTPVSGFADFHDEDEDEGFFEEETKDVMVRAGGLCVGGAIIGSFVPVIGNLVGCAVGSVSGWWLAKRKHKRETELAAPATDPVLDPAGVTETGTAGIE
jgi:hypothetical protein